MVVKENGEDPNRSIVGEGSDVENELQYDPILPEVKVPTMEEDEDAVLVVRAKLYRFDRSNEEPEWKERGLGELKMLKHKTNHTVRIVMRRDKTLKVCANHFITPLMELRAKPGTDRSFIYTVLADFADEYIKSECLAIKFGSAENASQFKKHFLESQMYVQTNCKLYNGEADAELNKDSGEWSPSSEEEDDDDDQKPAEVESNAATAITEKLEQLDVSGGDKTE